MKIQPSQDFSSLICCRGLIFSSSEKRLARILLVLASFGLQSKPEPAILKVSQETLAEMVGTTRSRVSYFFLGQQQVFPAFLRGSIFLTVLALLPFPVMIYWLIRARFSKAYEIQPPPDPALVSP